MNVVITGGCGFIGSHVTEMHLTSKDNVISIDNFSTGTNNIQHTNYKCLQLDLSDSKNVQDYTDIIKSADLVYHFAGSVGVKYIDDNPRDTLRNTHNINNIIFPVFEDYNSRVIFASTSEVYGDSNEACETDSLNIGATDKLRWGYACSKLMSEFLLKTYNFPSTVVRFFNVTGRGQIHNHGMVLPTFITKAQRGEDLTIYGDGKQSRSFCDIRDACEMLKIISDDQHVNQTYNIGNANNNITINNLAKKVITIAKSESNIVYVDYKNNFSSQFGEIYERKPNTAKINKFYETKYDINDIIRSML
jgi:UDP-glucose 4-epimerase